jgi:hypothetical protein
MWVTDSAVDIPRRDSVLVLCSTKHIVAVAAARRLYPSHPLPAERLATFVNAWIKGVDGVTYTPKGLAYSTQWGSLRHVGNAMFLMKAYAKGKPASLKPALKVSTPPVNLC